MGPPRMLLFALLTIFVSGCSIVQPRAKEGDRILVEQNRQLGKVVSETGMHLQNPALAALGGTIADNSATLQINLVGKPDEPVNVSIDAAEVAAGIVASVTPALAVSEDARSESDADHATDLKPDDPIPWWVGIGKQAVAVGLTLLVGGGGVQVARGRKARTALAATIEAIQRTRATAGNGGTLNIGALLGNLERLQKETGTRHLVRAVKHKVDEKINGDGAPTV